MDISRSPKKNNFNASWLHLMTTTLQNNIPTAPLLSSFPSATFQDHCGLNRRQGPRPWNQTHEPMSCPTLDLTNTSKNVVFTNAALPWTKHTVSLWCSKCGDADMVHVDTTRFFWLKHPCSQQNYAHVHCYKTFVTANFWRMDWPASGFHGMSLSRVRSKPEAPQPFIQSSTV